MKKLILLFAIVLGTISLHAQKEPVTDPLSIKDIFSVFDQYGNTYKLSDIQVNNDTRTARGTNEVLSNTLLCSPGIFDVYFETGCGIDGNTDAEIQRRNVVCQVLQDISNFINSPLKDVGNTNRVRIWVRNINNIQGVPSGVLGLVTPFYSAPGVRTGTTTYPKGILDNEIWKTIHNGTDSYTNILGTFQLRGGNNTDLIKIFHGMMAFNFTNIAWNTTLGSVADANSYDLYSVILHEITHALGFQSLINYDGMSIYGGIRFNYYSRYDRFLKNNANTQFLITGTNANSTMYDYQFNPSLDLSVLYPGCTFSTPVNSSTPVDKTICGKAIQYVNGSTIIPVYTPACFEDGSSLSHFEDQNYPSCNYNNNNLYFTMSNVNGKGVTKRFLKLEERQVLCDIGYGVKSTYGNAATALNSYKDYQAPECGGITVAGINDGINTDKGFTFITTVGTAINIPVTGINGILANDRLANGFEGLQDIDDTSAIIPITMGTTGALPTFKTNIPGLHVLRYVPTNSSGQKGNITYLYIYVTGSDCASYIPSCNLVANGDFEQYSALPNSVSQLDRACGWNPINLATPDYMHGDSTNNKIGVPCNSLGVQADNISVNKAYANMIIDNRPYYESIFTRLKSPLLSNTSYQISFDVSVTEGLSTLKAKLQAYVSPTVFIKTDYGEIPIANSNMLFKSPTFSTISNGWEHLTFIIPASSVVGGEQYLYIGGLNGVEIMASTPAAQVSGCSYTDSNTNGNPEVSYYVDNVRLEALSGILNTPTAVCVNQTISNLGGYLSSAPANGVFSSTGSSVTLTNGVYSFKAPTVGTYTVTYTYTLSSGCSFSISDSIIVNDCSGATCLPDLTFSVPETATAATYQASNTIVASGNYLVNSGAVITIQAGNSITFGPSSEVKAGSNFTAKIAPCTNPGTRNREVQLPESITIYPNPTNDWVTISTNGEDIKTIMIVAIDGKLIANQNIGNSSSCQFNMGNYQKGIYILTVETKSGSVFKEKVIKN